ncbi:MAG: sel1 repeat family protein [Gammaproteobacteria bacterium]|nr:sel1 repeat family protein [Gammaproteobacteria bacterium]NIR82987.1 sel1 repeat family protein [Gammaproteobacteria bacterium]NIU04129.1 sel1 repeat family protein [Gammaproteobacteria bacterium]NIX85403.1 hypothetical protein [Gammaproteobacteria bacterium]
MAGGASVRRAVCGSGVRGGLCAGLIALAIALSGCVTTPVPGNADAEATAARLEQVYGRARTMYLGGEYQRAFRLLLPLARRGHADAQYAVGFMYYYGEGVSRDVGRALNWFARAAEQGHPKAIEARARLTEGAEDEPGSESPP